MGPAFILKAAAPAIVWCFKGVAFSAEFYLRVKSLALQAAASLASSKDFDDLMLLSHFWRAMAMDPAAVGDSKRVSEMMAFSRQYAGQASPNDPLEECRKLDVIKTYFESSVKEHLHCTRDLDQAQAAALELIKLDPEWPVSRLEAAEVAFTKDQPLLALNQLSIAAGLGGPRKTVSLYYQGQALELLERYPEAIAVYQKVLDRDPTCISALENLICLIREKGLVLPSRAGFLQQEYEARGVLMTAGGRV